MIAIIVAVDEKWGIGKDGRIPWHYSEDMKYFAKTTKGSTCIMGRVTAEDIMSSHSNEKLLPNRESIVITRNPDFVARDAIVAESLQDAIVKASRDDIFIIGGKGLYEQAYDHIDLAFITYVPGVHDCDTDIKYLVRNIQDNFESYEEIKSGSGLIFKKYVNIGK